MAEKDYLNSEYQTTETRLMAFTPNHFKVVLANRGLGYEIPKYAMELLLRLGAQLRDDGHMFFRERISNLSYSVLDMTRGYIIYEINLLKRIIKRGGFQIIG